MKSLLFWLLSGLPLLAQTTIVKENLGPSVNTVDDQILPVFSLDGQTLYFSENSDEGRYEIWFSRRDAAGNWQPKQKAEGLNPPTDGSKYVFAQVEDDLLLVNGWFEQTGGAWVQSKGLSWYIPSQQRFLRLEIPGLQTQARGRFVNAFLHRPTKTLWLSYAENERKNLYVCLPENPSASWTALRWRAPERLPALINSEFDDTTPFLDTDGATLYFASNRPGGYGTDDIYRSRRLDDSWTSWSPPENLGFSVNSNFSEIYYCVSPLRDFSYFVSYKHSYGSGDIFQLRADTLQNPLASLPPPSRDTILVPPPTLQPVEVTELTVDQYRPNNLVFLIDRSASMRPGNKLPLLQLSLKRLIGELRNIDRLTLISFADTASINFSAQGVTQKDSLYHLIDEFVATGRTKANQGLQLAYDYTEQQFVEDGNNEIILVTDGLFRLSTQDHQRIQSNPRIVLSTVGLGSNRQALAQLQEMAAGANGSFIHIRNAETGTEALLEEVKARSRR
ncbi:MAG: VWA domain-containing protein [Bacteroidota bacterium]